LGLSYEFCSLSSPSPCCGLFCTLFFRICWECSHLVRAFSPRGFFAGGLFTGRFLCFGVPSLPFGGNRGGCFSFHCRFAYSGFSLGRGLCLLIHPVSFLPSFFKSTVLVPFYSGSGYLRLPCSQVPLAMGERGGILSLGKMFYVFQEGFHFSVFHGDFVVVLQFGFFSSGVRRPVSPRPLHFLSSLIVFFLPCFPLTFFFPPLLGARWFLPPLDQPFSFPLSRFVHLFLVQLSLRFPGILSNFCFFFFLPPRRGPCFLFLSNFC